MFLILKDIHIFHSLLNTKSTGFQELCPTKHALVHCTSLLLILHDYWKNRQQRRQADKKLEKDRERSTSSALRRNPNHGADFARQHCHQDLMFLKVFSNRNASMILWIKTLLPHLTNKCTFVLESLCALLQQTADAKIVLLWVHIAMAKPLRWARVI